MKMSGKMGRRRELKKEEEKEEVKGNGNGNGKLGRSGEQSKAGFGRRVAPSL
jgi:hypothetical protein